MCVFCGRPHEQRLRDMNPPKRLRFISGSEALTATGEQRRQEEEEEEEAAVDVVGDGRH